MRQSVENAAVKEQVPGGTGCAKVSAPSKPPSTIPKPSVSGLLKQLVAKDIARVLRTLAEQGTVPFVAVHGANDDSLAPDFEPSQYPGLIFCHQITVQCDRRLISYWQSRESFDTYSPTFVAQLTDGKEAYLTGSLARYSRKAEAWWERFPFWKVVITAAALIGAVAALGQSGAQLIERPDITVTFDPDMKPNVLRGVAPTKFKFWITNQCRFASAKVGIKSVLVPAALERDKVDFPKDESARLSKIEAGKAQEFWLQEPLQDPPDGSDRPLAYKLELNVTSKAGFLRGERSFTFESPAIRAWQRVVSTKPQLNIQANPDECRFVGTVYSGADQTIQAVAKVAFPFAILSMVTEVQNQRVTNYTTSGSGTVGSQSLEIKGFREFQPYDYEVVVRGATITPPPCQSMLEQRDVRVNFNPGGN